MQNDRSACTFVYGANIFRQPLPRLFTASLRSHQNGPDTRRMSNVWNLFYMTKVKLRVKFFGGI